MCLSKREVIIRPTYIGRDTLLFSFGDRKIVFIKRAYKILRR